MNNTKMTAGKSTKAPVLLKKSNPSPGPSKIEGPGRGKSMNKNVQQITTNIANKPAEISNEEEVPKTRKKKKPNASKLERQRKREEEKFKQLYGPKDSHIQLISHAVLQKLQGIQPPKRSTTATINKMTNNNQILPTPSTAQQQQHQVIQPRTLFSAEDSFPPLSSSSTFSSTPTLRNRLHMTAQDFPALNSEDFTNANVTITPATNKEHESEWETDTENNIDEENQKTVKSITKTRTTTDQVKSQITNTGEKDIEKKILQGQVISSSSNKTNKSSSNTTISYLSIVTTPRPKPTVAVTTPSSKTETTTIAKVIEQAKSTAILGQNENLPGTSKKKLSKKPMVISLDDLIVKKSTTKDSRVKTKRKVDVTKHFKTNLTIGNTLDSSGPRFIHRGKIREKPKKKKPTKLKLAIMKTRLVRQQKRLKRSTSTSNLIQSTLKSDFVGIENIDNNNSGNANNILKEEVDNFKNDDSNSKKDEDIKNEVMQSVTIKNEDNNNIDTVVIKSISVSDNTEKNDQNENDPLLATTKSKKKKRKKSKSQTLSTTVAPLLLNTSSKFVPVPEDLTLNQKEKIKQEEVEEEQVKRNLSSSSSLSPIHIQKTVIKNESTIIDDVNIFGNLLNTALKQSKEINNKIVEASQDPAELSVAEKIKCFSPEVISKAKESLHSRKFKPYCDMYPSKELHGCVIALMKELHRFQDRLYHSDPIKFKTKRRYIHGIKDAINNLKLNKVTLIIFAPDIESNDTEGGLDEKIEEIKSLAKDKNVPVIYSGNRFILGKPIFAKTSVSVIAILDRQGAEELFHKVLEQAKELREKYENDLYDKLQNIVQK